MSQNQQSTRFLKTFDLKEQNRFPQSEPILQSLPKYTRNNSERLYFRSRQETPTRLSCYLSWVASQYGMEGTSSEFQATWSTGCPQDEDIRVGAPGTKSKSDKSKKGKERNRLNKKNIKGNKKKKNKAERLIRITEDSEHNIEITL